MNVTTANTYDIAPEILLQQGFEQYKVTVHQVNGDREMTLYARSEYEVDGFMRNHWGWDTHYTVSKLLS